MVTFPNAKINLGLNILGKRTDGFHDIETVMYPVPFCDILEILPNPDEEFTFSSSGYAIDGDPGNNLCVKAWELMQKHYKLPAISMHLHKSIPMGAGLGGGSSDAARVLLMLNDLFRLNIDQETLSGYAAMLGSDCPFFILNTPSLARGRGELLEPANVSLKGLHLVMLKPSVSVNTAWAYRNYKKSKNAILPSEAITLGMHQWREFLVNDFEEAVFEAHPEIGMIKERLYSMGAVYASMSGSGSVVYGLFKTQVEVDSLQIKDALIRTAII
jgi:4-diphosphocytidyl-2-C-methyl-D-erythritol kinase